MTQSNTISELLDVIDRRIDLLRCLAADSADKRTLVEELDQSRSTIDRAVRELEAFDLIKYCDGKYEPTLCGRFAAAEYQQFNRRMACLIELRPFLQWLPDTVFADLELDWLLDADLWLPEPGNPFAMVNRHVSQLETTTSLRALLPLVGLHAHEVVYETVMYEDGDVELVVEPDAADTLESNPDYTSQTEELAATDRYRVFVGDDSVPCYIGLLDDDLVQLGVDDEGDPQALLETTNENLRAWAEQQYHSYKQQSRQVM